MNSDSDYDPVVPVEYESHEDAIMRRWRERQKVHNRLMLEGIEKPQPEEPAPEVKGPSRGPLKRGKGKRELDF